MDSFMGISFDNILLILWLISYIALVIVHYLERKCLTKQYEELKKEFEELREKYIVTKISYKTVSRHDPDLD